MYYAVKVKVYPSHEDVWWNGSIAPGIFEFDTWPRKLHPLRRRQVGGWGGGFRDCPAIVVHTVLTLARYRSCCHPFRNLVTEPTELLLSLVMFAGSYSFFTYSVTVRVTTSIAKCIPRRGYVVICVYFLPLVDLMRLRGFEVLNRVGLYAASKLTVLRPRKEGPWIDPSTCAPRAVALVLSLAVLVTSFVVGSDNEVITRRVLWAGWFACEGAGAIYSSSQKGGRVECRYPWHVFRKFATYQDTRMLKSP